jgi:hypothetical protein
MAAMSDYLEDALLEHVLNSVPYTDPTSVYVALFTAAPSDTGGGTEVSGNGYARVTMTAGWTITGTATRAENTAAVTFPQASGGNWGTITHVGIFDAATVGNLLFHGALTASKVVNDTDQIEFPATTLGVTLT